MENTVQHQPDKAPMAANLRVILWLFVFAAAAEFVIRGPVRFLFQETAWNDLSQNYTASRLWLKGQSPSDPKGFVALWRQEKGSRLDLTDIRTHLAPPLGGLVVMAPIAAFHWRVARVLWVTLLLIAFAATVWAFVLIAGFADDRARTLTFIAVCLALAPFHTGIANGNPTVLVIGLCAIAILAAARHRDIAAGLLFGVACSVKPQLGAFLVLYYLVRRRWQLFSTAVATTTGLVLVAVLYLWLRGASWMQDYLHNARGFVTANSIDDFSTANPIRFTLINLQVPFFSFTGQSSSANLLALTVAGILLMAWLYWLPKGRDDGPELLFLGAISVIGLLPVYHRFYDAALLVVPLSWCVSENIGRSKTIATTALLLITPFLFPGAAFLQQLALHGEVSSAAAHSWWWDSLVMPHETWALLFLSCILLYAIIVNRSARSQEASPET